MPAIRHTHQYIRSKANKQIYVCADPDCTTFSQRKMLIGRASICNGPCGGKFVLTERKLRLAAPKCDLCSNTKESRKIKKMAEKLGSIFENDLSDGLSTTEEQNASSETDSFFESAGHNIKDEI